eukprot:5244635-Prymnesium_polylepis.1
MARTARATTAATAATPPPRRRCVYLDANPPSSPFRPPSQWDRPPPLGHTGAAPGPEPLIS